MEKNADFIVWLNKRIENNNKRIENLKSRGYLTISIMK